LISNGGPSGPPFFLKTVAFVRGRVLNDNCPMRKTTRQLIASESAFPV